MAQLRYRPPGGRRSPSPAVNPDAGSYCVLRVCPRGAAPACVLRVCPRAAADAFWSALRAEREIPDAIAVLLAGRIRVEITRQEAAEALGSAAGNSGRGSA